MALRRPRQLELPVPATWGGRRCKRRGAVLRRREPPRCLEARRPPHRWHQPVHVTLRAVPGLRSFRGPRVFVEVRDALAKASKPAFRVCEFSVQSNHLHLLVEADSRQALIRGVQGLAIRTARAISRALGRCGKVRGDRYHARALTTPREVRNALVYVLQNAGKHDRSGPWPGIDRCSSAPWFAGWQARPLGPPPRVRAPVVAAKTWLLGAGWKRHGLLDVNERPRG